MKQKSILFSLLTSKPSLGFRVWSLGLRVHGVIFICVYAPSAYTEIYRVVR